MSRFSMIYFRVYRSAVLMRTEKKQIQVISNSKICSQHNIPSPSAYLSSIRLKHLYRVCSFAPLELKTLIWADFLACPKFSWLGLCFADLVWLKATVPCLDTLPDPFEEYIPWYSMTVDLTKYFSNMLTLLAIALASQFLILPCLPKSVLLSVIYAVRSFSILRNFLLINGLCIKPNPALGKRLLPLIVFSV